MLGLTPRGIGMRRLFHAVLITRSFNAQGNLILTVEQELWWKESRVWACATGTARPTQWLTEERCITILPTSPGGHAVSAFFCLS